jgi:hypothetical protein
VTRCGGLLVAAALAASGCQRAADPSVADYLPPLEEGRTLVYQMSDGPRRLARIVRVTRAAEGEIRVETASTLDDPDAPAAATPVKALSETYRFVPKEGAIVWAVGDRPEVVFLKGPLAVGTRWPVTTVTGGAVDVDARHGGGAHRTVSGTCRIDRLATRRVLGEERPCVEVVCEFPDPQVAFSARTVACKGLGYVETDERVTVGGEAQPTTIGERLVEVR